MTRILSKVTYSICFLITFVYISTTNAIAGNIIRGTADNLLICTSSVSCTLTAPAGKGNLLIENKFGINVGQPTVPLDILTTSNETGINLTNSAAGTRTRYSNTGTGGRIFDTVVTGGASGFGPGKFVISDRSTDLSIDTPRLVIDAAGNVGIGTTTPDSLLTVNGSITSLYTGDTVRTFRNVAAFNSNAASTTGTMKIVLPTDWSSTMMTIKITGYDYSATTGPWELTVGGYNYLASTQWINYAATSKGRLPFTSVRLARDTSLAKNVILLGTVSTVWAYPKLVVSEVNAGFSSWTGWGSGWSISIINPELNIANAVTPVIDNYTSSAGNLMINGGLNAPQGITTPQFYNTAAGYNYSNTYLQFNGYYGYYWPSGGQHFYPTTINDYIITSGAANNAGLAMANNAGSIYGYFYGDSSGAGILDLNRNWAIRADTAISYTGLVGYWQFEGNGNDISGYSATLTTSNIAWKNGGGGRSGYWADLNGSSAYFYTNTAQLNAISGDFTAAAWVKRTGIGNVQIVSKTSTPGTGGFAMLIGNGGEVYCRTDNGTTYQDSYTAAGWVLNNGAWTHIAVAKSGTSCRIYINGVDRTSIAASHTLAANSRNLSIGVRSDLNFEYLAGGVDDVMIYNRVLTAAEVAKIAGYTPSIQFYKNLNTNSYIKSNNTLHGRWTRYGGNVSGTTWYGWDTQLENFGGFTRTAYNVTNGAIVVPVTGTYLVNLNMLCYDPETRTDVLVYNTNGTMYIREICSGTTAAGYSTHGSSVIVQMNAGEGIAVQCSPVVGAGSCHGTSTSSNKYSTLEITKLN